MDENVTAMMHLYSTTPYVATADVSGYSTHDGILKKGGVMANGVAVPVWRVGIRVPSAPLRFSVWVGLIVLVLAVRGWWDWRTVSVSTWPVLALYSVCAFLIGHDVLCLRWSPSARWRLRLAFHAWFLYLWGLWGWSTNVTYSPAWWFDAAGHALYGAVFASDLCTYRVYADAWFEKYGELIYCAALEVVSLALAGGWELFEFFLDSVRHSGRFLQKDVEDTMWDIIAMISASACVIILRWCITAFRRWGNPALAQKYETGIDTLEEKSGEVRRLLVEMRGVVAGLQKEQQGVVLGRLEGWIGQIGREFGELRGVVRKAFGRKIRTKRKKGESDVKRNQA